MREGWQKVQLGELATQVKDSVKVISGAEYVLLGVSSKGRGVFSKEAVTSDTSKAKSFTPVRCGQFIYNRLFAGTGSFGVVPEAMDGTFVSNEFPVFDVDPSQLDVRFLGLTFEQPSVWADVEAQCIGSTGSRMRWKEDRFNEYRILLPPLAEQRRIVDLIGAVDKYLASREAELEAGLNARAAALTEELGRAGDDWIEMTLSELLSLEYGKALKEADRDGGIFPVLGSAGVSGSHSSSLTGDGPSIVVGRKGTAGSVHWVGGPSWAIDTAYFVRLKTAADLRFTFFLLQNLDLPSLCAQTGVPGLNRDRAHEQPCKVPPLSEQQRIAEFIGAFDEANAALRAEVEAVRSSRAALLAELLSGDYEIPESYDTLLERAS